MSDCWKKTGNHAEYCGRHGSEAGWPCAVAAEHEAMWAEIQREPPEWLRESVRDAKAGRTTERDLIYPDGDDSNE